MKVKPIVQVIWHDDVDAELGISAYVHCAKCLTERPKNITPEKWARTQIGCHRKGFQVWCVRHQCNIAILELKGKLRRVPEPTN